MKHYSFQELQIQLQLSKTALNSPIPISRAGAAKFNTQNIFETDLEFTHGDKVWVRPLVEQEMRETDGQGIPLIQITNKNGRTGYLANTQEPLFQSPNEKQGCLTRLFS